MSIASDKRILVNNIMNSEFFTEKMSQYTIRESRKSRQGGGGLNFDNIFYGMHIFWPKFYM